MKLLKEDITLVGPIQDVINKLTAYTTKYPCDYLIIKTDSTGDYDEYREYLSLYGLTEEEHQEIERKKKIREEISIRRAEIARLEQELTK